MQKQLYQKMRERIIKRQYILLMYFGQQPVGVLQLTGQLTIHMTSPTTQSQDPQQCNLSHSQTTRSSMSEQECFPSTRSNLEGQSSEQQNLKNYSLTQSHPQHVQQLQNSVKTLEERIRRMELSSQNVLKVNERTLETCQLLRNQIINKLNSHDELFLQRTKNFAEIQKNWIKKSEQRMEEAEVKLEKRRQELQKQMERKMKKLLEEERVQAEQVSQHKFEQIARELQKQKIQTGQQMKKMEEKLVTEIKKVVEEEKNNQQKAKRDSLRIKEEAEVVEVLRKKNSELQEKSKWQERNARMRRETEKVQREQMERMAEKKKQESENLFDRKTPFARFFLVEGNNITFQLNNAWFNQALLNMVVERGRKFVFSVQITQTRKGNIMIGVVDRHLQSQKQSSCSSGNAVCYSGVDSQIYYGEKGKLWTTKTGIELKTGMEVEVKVDLDQGTMGFSFHKGTSNCENKLQFSQQKSDILTQSYRKFVPYFQMWDQNDSIRWSIK